MLKKYYKPVVSKLVGHNQLQELERDYSRLRRMLRNWQQHYHDCDAAKQPMIPSAACHKVSNVVKREISLLMLFKKHFQASGRLQRRSQSSLTICRGIAINQVKKSFLAWQQCNQDNHVTV